MKIPIEWLKELVKFKETPEQLAHKLTMAGLETVVDKDVLEVDVLPNRSDCWSIRGIAREVSAIGKLKTQTSKIKINEFLGIATEQYQCQYQRSICKTAHGSNYPPPAEGVLPLKPRHNVWLHQRQQQRRSDNSLFREADNLNCPAGLSQAKHSCTNVPSIGKRISAEKHPSKAH